MRLEKMKWATLKRIGITAEKIRPGLIVYASTIQIIRGGLLAFGPGAAAGATATSGIVLFFGHLRWAGLFLIIAATLALYGLGRFHSPSLRALVWALPQQSALIISSQSAFKAVILSRYADGIPRPWDFILADQSPYLAAVVLYTATLIGYFVVGPLLEARALKNGRRYIPNT